LCVLGSVTPPVETSTAATNSTVLGCDWHGSSTVMNRLLDVPKSAASSFGHLPDNRATIFGTLAATRIASIAEREGRVRAMRIRESNSSTRRELTVGPFMLSNTAGDLVSTAIPDTAVVSTMVNG